MQSVKHTDTLPATKKYIFGFGLSLALSLAAFFLTKHHVSSGHSSPTDKATLVALMVLALTQLIVQLIFFLHLGDEPKPKWKLIITIFAAVVVFILVAGSLWIMWNLNYHMQPTQTDQHIIHDEGVHR